MLLTTLVQIDYRHTYVDATEQEVLRSDGKIATRIYAWECARDLRGQELRYGDVSLGLADEIDTVLTAAFGVPQGQVGPLEELRDGSAITGKTRQAAADGQNDLSQSRGAAPPSRRSSPGTPDLHTLGNRSRERAA